MNETSKDRITSYLKDVVSVLQQESLSASEPVGNCDTSNAICHAIEAVFLHDLKGSSIHKNFWSLLKKFTHKSTRAQIAELTQITTDIGKCRAWIRITLNDGAIESYLRLIVADNSLLKTYYRPSAYLRDVEKPDIMLTYVQGLCEFTFNLSTNSTVLNQWTSTALVLSGLLPYTMILRPVISQPATHRPTGQVQRSERPDDFEKVIVSRLPPSNSDLMSSLRLTQLDRNALHLHDEDQINVMSSPSTPTSLFSHPDFVDPRPDIYRFAFNVTPVSQMSCESTPNPSFNSRASSRCEDAVAVDICGAGFDEDPNTCVGLVKSIADDSQKTGEKVAVIVGDSDSHQTTDGRGIGDNRDPFFLESASTEEQVTSDSQFDAYSKSFDQLLKNYNASTLQYISPTMHASLLPGEEIIHGIPPVHTGREFGTSPVDTSPDDNQNSNSELDERLHLRICNEAGLNQQSYQCRGCTRPIGMCTETKCSCRCVEFPQVRCQSGVHPVKRVRELGENLCCMYGKERLCNYDGFYYCSECHNNNVHCIPARIIYNWDFRPYQVCEKNLMVLSSTYDEPVIDLDKVNMLLYDHVAALHAVLLLRKQLRSLTAYLSSCRQPVANQYMSFVFEKNYLVETVHTYSLKDLHHISSGVLASRLKKAVDYGTQHVYDCVLCSQKGFICEICQNPQVIYPFQLMTTSRCETCRAVFHDKCKTSLVSCPRCRRRRSLTPRSVNPVEHVSFSFDD